MGRIDIEKLKLRNDTVNPSAAPRIKSGEKFLKGPIPLPWLSKATALPGKAVNVALAIWFLRGLTKSETVRLTNATLKLFGVKRQAGYRGLKSLENTGLVTCARSPGRCPVVTIITTLPNGGEYEK